LSEATIPLLDASGMSCPMPLLKTKQYLNTLSEGEVLHVISTDSGSVRDFQSYISLSAHSLMKKEERDQSYHFWIKKGASSFL